MKMQQPATPTVTPSEDRNGSSRKNISKKKLPTPQELVAHYQSQGLDSQEASIKVIEDLQGVLFRFIASNDRNKKDKLVGEADLSRKIDAVNTRLSVVDMKLDSKPGYAETLAIGVASGAAFRGVESVWPHVFGGIAQIWNAVRSATKPPSSS